MLRAHPGSDLERSKTIQILEGDCHPGMNPPSGLRFRTPARWQALSAKTRPQLEGVSTRGCLKVDWRTC